MNLGYTVVENYNFIDNSQERAEHFILYETAILTNSYMKDKKIVKFRRKTLQF